MPSAIPSASRNRLLLLWAALCALLLWSACTDDGEEVYVLSFSLDSSKVGKFDSLRLDVYNGQPPGPGEKIQPVQSKTIALTPTTRVVRLQLVPAVKAEFSVVATGIDSTGPVYRKQYSYAGFTPDKQKPPVVL